MIFKSYSINKIKTTTFLFYFSKIGDMKLVWRLPVTFFNYLVSTNQRSLEYHTLIKFIIFDYDIEK